ncbi:MAG: sugar phosphate isomerase/epimerase family protein [Caldilineaceae bacterium]
MPRETYAAGLWVFAQSEEKFGGYNKSWTVREQIAAAASVPGLKGLELISPLHVSLETARDVKLMLDDAGITPVSVNPYVWTEPQWRNGALTAPDPAVRRAAIDRAREAIDIGNILGCKRMDLWPGEDGFDTLFQADYGCLWDWTMEGLFAIGSYDPATKIGVEYKIEEPRTHQFVSNAGKAALMGALLGLPNVGAYLDFGHALMAREVPAETVVMLQRAKRLMGVHVNDNFGLADDDLMVGTVNFWALLEFLLALDETGYDGWVTLDIVPRRETATAACARSIEMLNTCYTLLGRLDRTALHEAQSRQDAVDTQRVVQQMLLG